MAKKRNLKPKVEFQPEHPYSESESEYWGCDRKPVSEEDLVDAAGADLKVYQCEGIPELCNVYGDADICQLSCHAVFPPKACPWGLDEACSWKEICKDEFLDKES